MNCEKYQSLEGAVSGIFGEGNGIRSSTHVGGGDINDAVTLTLQNGARVFVKSNRGKPIDFFEAEAVGLKAIENTGAISVPKVLALGQDRQLGAFLMLSYVESAARVRDYWEDFAERLYRMHTAPTESLVNGHSSIRGEIESDGMPVEGSPAETSSQHGDKFGLLNDNYIGSTPQKNAVMDSWIDFFRENRLRPLFERASAYFDPSMTRRIDRFLENLDRWLVEPDHPSLIHGDLWGGNAMVGDDGRAWLIDPAAYVGHAEADLAMTELFGGFSPGFYSRYRRLSGMGSDYADRRDIYNLYHLTNHLILFGGSYYGSVERIVTRYAGR